MKISKGRIGEYNEFVEISNGGTAKFVAQKGKDNLWSVYYLNRREVKLLDSVKSKNIAVKLCQLGADVYFNICG